MNYNNTFYFDEQKLYENFYSYTKISNLCYPLKTNSSNQIISSLKPLIEKEDNYFSISSLSHFKKLISQDILPIKISLINVLCDDFVVKNLYENGVRFFTFDNINSIQSFLTYAKDKNCKISFRLNIFEIFNKKSHLGASVDEIKKMMELLNGNFPHVGISFYLPLEIKTKRNSLTKILNFIAKNFSGKNIEFLCVAGLEQAYKIDINKLNEIKSQMKLKNLYLEPGQFLLENTLHLETKLLRYKDNILVIKNGIFSGFLDKLIYNKKFDLYIKDKDKVYPLYYNPSLNRYSVKVYGGSGDSADFIGKYYIDKKYSINKESKIFIKNVGAYFEEFYIPHGGDIFINYKKIYKK